MLVLMKISCLALPQQQVTRRYRLKALDGPRSQAGSADLVKSTYWPALTCQGNSPQNMRCIRHLRLVRLDKMTLQAGEAKMDGPDRISPTPCLQEQRRLP